MPASAELLLLLARELHDLDLSPTRAAEIARELAPLDNAVRAAAARLTLADEPSAYAAWLNQDVK